MTSSALSTFHTLFPFQPTSASSLYDTLTRSYDHIGQVTSSFSFFAGLAKVAGFQAAAGWHSSRSSAELYITPLLFREELSGEEAVEDERGVRRQESTSEGDEVGKAEARSVVRSEGRSAGRVEGPSLAKWKGEQGQSLRTPTTRAACGVRSKIDALFIGRVDRRGSPCPGKLPTVAMYRNDMVELVPWTMFDEGRPLLHGQVGSRLEYRELLEAYAEHLRTGVCGNATRWPDTFRCSAQSRP